MRCKHAVRAAISPCFSVPFVETAFDVDHIRSHVQSDVERCQGCRKERTVEGKNLLTCSRYHAAKFCSAECQHADWKVHKRICSK